MKDRSFVTFERERILFFIYDINKLIHYSINFRAEDANIGMNKILGKNPDISIWACSESKCTKLKHKYHLKIVFHNTYVFVFLSVTININLTSLTCACVVNSYTRTHS